MTQQFSRNYPLSPKDLSATSSRKIRKAEELIRQAEAAMPCYDEDGDWCIVNKLVADLAHLSDVRVLVFAGPETDRARVRGLEVDFWSSRGIEYDNIRDYLETLYGSLLGSRELSVMACLLENVHQHVRQGIGLCIIQSVPGQYRKISVIDNGRGFYDYRNEKELPIRDALRFGKSYGQKYRSLGQALATAFGVWADCATIETPHESVIVTPESAFKKGVRGFIKILSALTLSALAGLATLIFNESSLLIAGGVAVLLFAVFMKWDTVRAAVTKEPSVKKCLPGIRFRIKNTQRFGSTIHVYFCDAPDTSDWRSPLIRHLRPYLDRRATTFRPRPDGTDNGHSR